jgi:hypothetical protein
MAFISGRNGNDGSGALPGIGGIDQRRWLSQHGRAVWSGRAVRFFLQAITLTKCSLRTESILVKNLRANLVTDQRDPEIRAASDPVHLRRA